MPKRPDDKMDKKSGEIFKGWAERRYAERGVDSKNIADLTKAERQAQLAVAEAKMALEKAEKQYNSQYSVERTGKLMQAMYDKQQAFYDSLEEVRNVLDSSKDWRFADVVNLKQLHIENWQAYVDLMQQSCLTGISDPAQEVEDPELKHIMADLFDTLNAAKMGDIETVAGLLSELKYTIRHMEISIGRGNAKIHDIETSESTIPTQLKFYSLGEPTAEDKLDLPIFESRVAYLNAALSFVHAADNSYNSMLALGKEVHKFEAYGELTVQKSLVYQVAAMFLSDLYNGLSKALGKSIDIGAYTGHQTGNVAHKILAPVGLGGTGYVTAGLIGFITGAPVGLIMSTASSAKKVKIQIFEGRSELLRQQVLSKIDEMIGTKPENRLTPNKPK